MGGGDIFQTMVVDITECVNLNDLRIPYCTSSDFPMTLGYYANYCHMFWVIPIERISESTSQGHQIDHITKLRSIRECLSTTQNGIFKPPWFKFNNIWFYISLENPKWLNCREWSINFYRWIRIGGYYLCRIRSNNRC